jgi:hypothetical protein
VLHICSSLFRSIARLVCADCITIEDRNITLRFCAVASVVMPRWVQQGTLVEIPATPALSPRNDTRLSYRLNGVSGTSV